MNFFEQQDRARKQTKRLIAAFVLAVIAIVVAMNVVVLFAFGMLGQEGAGLPSASATDSLLPAIAITSAITILVIVIASAWRTAQLRGGGARVASELGGVPVDGSTTDPLRRRLLNVVEEMAIASGVPVPRVFVLEQESGINAFAAGWSTTDAAVAVTRGALEQLSREELQGVIAHEFSHVFNGDMRLNIRLMGVLFGILVIAVVGRRMLSSMRFSIGRSRNNKGGGIVLVALAIMVIGYIGLFFGRWIQAAVSRQREYLADASAVQFTRSPDGIAGALKKIGALSSGSVLETNTDEVGHMLFASGLARRMFATHPPLTERIREIDPSFQPREFAALAKQMAEQSQSRAAEREETARAAESEPAGAGGLPGVLTGGAGGGLADAIGEPGMHQMLLVAALLEAVPTPLSRAAHSDEWAPELLLYLLLGRHTELRERQLLMIAQARGSDSETKVRDLIGIEPDLDVQLRLPLLELAFPALRRRPEREWLELMRLIDKLIEADGRVEVFEYVLARLLSHEIGQALNPPRRAPGGKRAVSDLAQPITELIRVVAHHGQPDDPDAARAALAAAMHCLELGEPGAPPEGDHWQERLDEALRALRDLSLKGREQLLDALLECVRHDQKVRTREYELMRLVAGLLDVPLPPIAARPDA